VAPAGADSSGQVGPESSDANASGRAAPRAPQSSQPHSRMVIGPGRRGCHTVRDLHTAQFAPLQTVPCAGSWR
jgi:hypothetical protein